MIQDELPDSMKPDPIEPKRVYETAKDMFNELTGCGCCCYDYDNGFDDLKAMILKEVGVTNG